MASDASGRDLLVLVADSNMGSTVRGLLTRPEALGIRKIRFSVLPHPEHDPGCFLRAPEFLRSFRKRYQHALVLLDRDGSGREEVSRQGLEEDLQRRLEPDWGARARAVVLDPELEVWLWSDSPHVEDVLGWRGREPALRVWLKEDGLWAEGSAKPERPKEAVEKALREARKPRSSALYRQLAEKVSFKRCEDPAFHEFLATLRSWFPAER